MILFSVLLSRFLLCSTLQVISPSSISGVYYHVDAHFGPSISKKLEPDTTYDLVAAEPDLGACTPLSGSDMQGTVALILRGGSFINDTADDSKHCSFVQKVMRAQRAGALAVVIGNNVGSHQIMPMYNADDVQPDIPAISVSHNTFYAIYEQIEKGHSITVRMNEKGKIEDDRFNTTLERWVTGIVSVLILLAGMSLVVAGFISLQLCIRHIRDNLVERARRRHLNESIPRIQYSSQRLISSHRSEIEINDGSSSKSRSPSSKRGTRSTEIVIQSAVKSESDESKKELIKEDALDIEDTYCLHNETCYVCLEDFEDGEGIRVLQCKHGFHDKCITSWVIEKGKCPICKRDVFENI